MNRVLRKMARFYGAMSVITMDYAERIIIP